MGIAYNNNNNMSRTFFLFIFVLYTVRMAYTPSIAEPTSTATEPETIALKSSFLSAASYDPVNYAITLAFKNGYTSIHRFVFPSVWNEFKISTSHGSYYANVLKKQYPAIPLHQKLRVSDLTKAQKTFNPRAKGSHANSN